MKSLGKSTLRAVSVVLSVLMLMSIFTVIAAHANVNLQYSYDHTNTLTISGDGILERDAKLGEYLDKAETIIIEDGITGIAPKTLTGSDNLKTLKIAGTVETIGYENFQECPNLEEVELSEGLKVIGNGAFSNSEALKTITIPDSVTQIDDGVLYNLPNLEDVKLGEGLKIIGESSLSQLPIITSIELPDGLENIMPYALSDTPNMASITIPSSVTSISDESVGYYYDNSENAYVKLQDFVIYGAACSEAQRYADANGFTFEDSSSPVSDKVKITYDLNGGTPAKELSEEQQNQFNLEGKYTEEAALGTNVVLSKESLENIVTAPEGKEIEAVEVNSVRYELTGVTYVFNVDSEVKFLYKDKADENKCKISFDVNGGSASDSAPEEIKTSINDTGRYTREVEKGQALVLSKEFLEEYVTAPEGMVLDGIDINGARYGIDSTIVVTKNLSAKYLWVESSASEFYTITYDLNGATIKDGLYFDNPQIWKSGMELDFYRLFIGYLNYPADKTLDYIEINGVKHDAHVPYTLNEDITVKCFWKDAPVSGTTGDCNWSFDKNTGTLTISGKGKTADYEWGEAPWFTYKDEIKNIVIEDGVTGIGDMNFIDCSKVTDINIPSSVESIGRAEFANTGIKSIAIPATVKTIGKNAVGYDIQNGTGMTTIIKDFVIYADKNTAAAKYAEENSIKREDYSKAPASKASDTTVKKSANTIKVTAKTKTIKAKKLKKKKQTVKPLTVKNAQGKVTYKLVKKGTNKKIFKKIKINKKGAITFKKGKYAKKTYKIKVKVTAAGNSKYNKKTVTKTVKVKVK